MTPPYTRRSTVALFILIGTLTMCATPQAMGQASSLEAALPAIRQSGNEQAFIGALSGAAAALRIATLINRERFTEPKLWAPFTMYGIGR